MNNNSTKPRSNESLHSKRLAEENKRFAGTNGVSAGAKAFGLVPAFLDTATGRTYRSCFADGRPAPLHLIDGLPEGVRLTALSGFIGEGGQERFYTRQEAAALYA